MSSRDKISSSEVIEEETWKDINNFEGIYQVSSLGRVKRVEGFTKRFHKGKLEPIIQPIKEKILKPSYNKKSGYPYVNLCKEGVCSPKTVHSIVAETFIGVPDNSECKVHVCHNDGIPSNCNVSNLRYDTVKGNAEDRYKHGTDAKGENNPRAILTELEVSKIKSILKTSKTIKEASNITGYGYSLVRSISQGVRWSWVEPLKD